MTKDLKVAIWNVTGITHKLDEMRFLRPLLGLTRLDRQRNTDIRNRLKVDNILEDIISYQKNWIDHLKQMDRNRIPKLASQYQPRGRRDIGRPRRKWRPRNTLTLEGTGPKT
jgi:hypothetical protein